MATTESDMVKCFLCESYFRFGPHDYDGKHLRKYLIDVCNFCLRSSKKDGINPRHEEKFLKHLEEKNLPVPERNENGLFPL